MFKVTWTARTNKEMPAKLRTEVILRTAQTANLVLFYLKKKLVGPRTGRMYGDHQASAIGEYPAKDTGRLVNTLQTHWDPMNLIAVVGSSVPYARALEKRPPRAGGRPWLNRAAQETHDQVKAIWAKPWTLK